MTANVFAPSKAPRRTRSRLVLPFALPALLVMAAALFVAFVLWPSWPGVPAPLAGPAIPITIAGELFDIPPAAIRVPVQRRPGPAERVDLAFLWPSLTPQANPGDKPFAASAADAEPAAADGSGRLFVTIAGLGAVAPPLERLRTIYPRYVEAEAEIGPDGLAILPFRAGTPYHGEDLVYFADTPERFFTRCTRPIRTVPGSCLHERLIGVAEVTLRFPRGWLDDWRSLAAGFERLITQLHRQGG